MAAQRVWETRVSETRVWWLAPPVSVGGRDVCGDPDVWRSGSVGGRAEGVTRGGAPDRPAMGERGIDETGRTTVHQLAPRPPWDGAATSLRAVVQRVT